LADAAAAEAKKVAAAAEAAAEAKKVAAEAAAAAAAAEAAAAAAAEADVVAAAGAGAEVNSFMCSACFRYLGTKGFSNSQLSKKKERRCKVCISTEVQSNVGNLLGTLKQWMNVRPEEGNGQGGVWKAIEKQLQNEEAKVPGEKNTEVRNAVKQLCDTIPECKRKYDDAYDADNEDNQEVLDVVMYNTVTEWILDKI
jgi:nucleoid-associated protein YgaU